MKSLDRLQRLVSRWARGIAAVGLAALLFQALATAGDPLLRWLANRPIHGLSDITGLASVMVIAACFPVIVAQRGNITIRFLGRALPARAALWVDAFGSCALLAFLGMIGVQLALYTGELAASGRTTWLLRIPVAPYWIVATALVVLSVFAQAVNVAADVARAVTGERPREESFSGFGGGSAESTDEWNR